MYPYLNTFIPLKNSSKISSNNTMALFGNSAEGSNSMSFNRANSYGPNSFAANYATSKGASAAAFNGSTAEGLNSFSANGGKAKAVSSIAFNTSICNGANSFTAGYNTKAYGGKALKCIGYNFDTKEVTIDRRYDISRIEPGSKIVFRWFNKLNSVIYSEYIVDYVVTNRIISILCMQ